MTHSRSGDGSTVAPSQHPPAESRAIPGAMWRCPDCRRLMSPEAFEPDAHGRCVVCQDEHDEAGR